MFLMYRVELKANLRLCQAVFKNKFLMYRVELKGSKRLIYKSQGRLVPNVPCGVESASTVKSCLTKIIVPNVPCGVERSRN